MLLQVSDMGRIGSQPVFHDNGLEMGVVFSEGGDKPFGGIAFTIVLSLPILTGDHFRGKRNDGLDCWMNQSTGHHLMIIGFGAVAIRLDTTGGATHLVGAVITGAIKSHEIMIAQDREMFQPLASLEIGEDRLEGVTEMAGVNRIQSFAQTSVGRRLLDAKEGFKVIYNRRGGILTPGFLVKVQEGG